MVFLVTQTQIGELVKILLIAGAPVLWSSKLQTRVADSSTDSDCIALSHAVKEAIFLRQILKELGISIQDPTQIFGDNQGAIALTKNPQFHQRTRHVRIREHFVRDMVKQGETQVVYISTSDMVQTFLQNLSDLNSLFDTENI